MINIKNPMNPMTQQWISEQFGMPACGLAFGSTTLPSAVFGTSAPVATSRKRQIEAIVGTKGHVDVAVMRGFAYLPGTNAWSPPLC